MFIQISFSGGFIQLLCVYEFVCVYIFSAHLKTSNVHFEISIKQIIIFDHRSPIKQEKSYTAITGGLIFIEKSLQQYYIVVVGYLFVCSLSPAFCNCNFTGWIWAWYRISSTMKWIIIHSAASIGKLLMFMVCFLYWLPAGEWIMPNKWKKIKYENDITKCYAQSI